MKTLADQGLQRLRRQRKAVGELREPAVEDWSGAFPKQEGRLSNPVQRRLTEHDVDEIVSAYRDGSSIDSLAAQLGVHRTTIIHHLDRRGIERRKVVRKMTDDFVRQAARRYESGGSLKAVASQSDIDARTLAREFQRAGVPVRPRRRWSSSN